LLFPSNSTFAFEACAAAHCMAQQLQQLGHKATILKSKDVKHMLNLVDELVNSS